MQLTRQRHTSKRAVLNMAAMIDVVFLLLIFFMCTSSFVRPERNLRSRLPQAGAPGAADAEPLDPVRIRLSRSPAGVVVTCDDQACATTDRLVGMLRARRALGDPSVIIQGAAAVPFGRMVTALDACHRAGLYRVAFSPKGTGP